MKPRIILAAKVTASSAVLGLAVLALNLLPSLATPWPSAPATGSSVPLPPIWIAMLALVDLSLCVRPHVQGFAALLLPRRIFLRVSALLQILAFAYFLCSFFMLPALPTDAMSLPIAHQIVASTPSFWFYALCVQLNGVLPSSLTWLATRAYVL